MKAEAETSQLYAQIAPGDPAPWFHVRSTTNPRYAFDTAAGRYVVLCFFASAGSDLGRSALAAVAANRALFDDNRMCFFGVSIDPGDEAETRVRESIPGVRYFLDFDGAVSGRYGAIPKDTKLPQPRVQARQFWIVLDPTLRVMRVVPFTPDGGEQAELFAWLKALPPPERFAGFEVPAPILVLPNVFEPEFCRHLIGLYEQHGGEESGFMREVDGKTIHVQDPNHKRRKDYVVEDPQLIRQLQGRIIRRINPEILKVYNFKATRMERYIVSCYSADDGGHFRAHRDNTTKGTAHRRFAVSINLNSEFEGGEVSFPEYGPRSYKAPAGGAVIFPCALLHAVSKVVSGRRFAFLPFLYDDEAAKIREANNKFLGDGVGSYRASA
jgi:predicted 2-oxoglutarate/Fe(II)-dependent dioxygenase YbiX/peroxiredoxin